MSIEHVESLWKVRYQFESLLPIYVQNRSEMETVLDGITNMGEIFLANKASVNDEVIKESLLDRLRLAMNLAKKTGQNINSLVQWTILDVPPRVGITWYKL